jgi:anti-sigma regulatory factor (Ser/Thr protein kinase)
VVVVMASWSRLFPGRPEQVAQARLFTRSVLAGRPEASTAELVVSELATNALLHSASGHLGGRFAVIIQARPDAVRVSVDDLDSADTPQAVAAPDEPRESGMGLVVVAAVAKEWGSVRTVTGRRVWAELAASDSVEPVA